jgi:transposase-like protein
LEEAMLPSDLPDDLPSFLERFGTDEQCRAYLLRARWPDGFRCSACGHERAWAHKARLIYECAACGKQHSLLAGTIFEQTKTGLSRWFLAIYLVTSSKGGISAMELKRQMGFGSYQTAWSWLHKIRKAMVRPEREPLSERVEADETYLGGPGRANRVAVPAARSRSPARSRPAAAKPGAAAWDGSDWPWCRTPRPKAWRASSAATSPARRPSRPTAGPATSGLGAAGYAHEPLKLATRSDAVLRLPAIHLVFGLAKRWLLGTHHGAISQKHLPAYLDEFVFRFNRRTAKSISHRFARLIEHAVQISPTTYRDLIAIPSPT